MNEGTPSGWEHNKPWGCGVVVPQSGTLLTYLHVRYSKAPYTLSVKMSDFTVWCHNWLKNWVNCAVLTGNSAGLRTVLYSRLSHRELRSSLRESHSFLSLPADTTMTSSQRTQQNWQKNPTNLMGNLCCAREHSARFFVQSFFAQTAQFNLECMGPFRFLCCTLNISLPTNKTATLVRTHMAVLQRS
jgi:hypothetical protein